MSWSLQLRNGDLFHQDGHYAQVHGPAKLIQDLRSQLLEHMGHDDMHPSFGSTLDGGTLPNGTNIEGVIHSMDVRQATLDIESEIRRIETDYQSKQLSRINDDLAIYGKSTLRRDEILQSINDIQFIQVADTLYVRIKVVPISGLPIALDVPVGEI